MSDISVLYSIILRSKNDTRTKTLPFSKVLVLAIMAYKQITMFWNLTI